MRQPAIILMYPNVMLLLLLACLDPAGPALRMDFTAPLTDIVSGVKRIQLPVGPSRQERAGLG